MTSHWSTSSWARLLAVSVTAAQLSGCAGGRAQQHAGQQPKRRIHQAEKLELAALGAARPVDPWADKSQLITSPPIGKTTALNLPERRRLRLRNGLRVLLVPDARVPLVYVRLQLRVGSIDDPAGREGLAEYTAEMLRQGVRGMDADAISRRVDMAGASLGVSSGYEFSEVSCSARKRALYICLDLVAKLVLQPTFPAGEMKEVRQQLLGQVRRTRDDPEELAFLHFDNQLYGDDHPAGRPVTLASIQTITRDELAAFHKHHYVPPSALLAISGDIDVDGATSRLRANFRNWRARPVSARLLDPAQDPLDGFRLLLVDKPDLSQSFFTLGHAGVRFDHPRRDVLRLVNFVLGGGGFSSRLMQQVRSQGGKTYGIRSAFSAHVVDGSFWVSSFTRNSEIVSTIGLVRKELRRIRTSPPNEAELRAAKGKLAGGYALGFQTVDSLTAALAAAELRGLPETYVSELPVRLEAVDAGLVAETARMYILPHRLVGAVVGKADVVGPLLRKAGMTFETVSYLDPISARARAEQRKAGQEQASHSLPSTQADSSADDAE